SESHDGLDRPRIPPAPPRQRLEFDRLAGSRRSFVFRSDTVGAADAAPRSNRCPAGPPAHARLGFRADRRGARRAGRARRAARVRTRLRAVPSLSEECASLGSLSLRPAVGALPPDLRALLRAAPRARAHAVNAANGGPSVATRPHTH